MAKSTYDRIQDILLESRLQTGRMGHPMGNGGQLSKEELALMQQLNEVKDFDELRKLDDFDKFLRS